MAKPSSWELMDELFLPSLENVLGEAAKEIGMPEVVVSVSHFSSASACPKPQQQRPFRRQMPDFNESDIYIKNPAPSSRLARKHDALALTDTADRTYWDACDGRGLHTNPAWIDLIKSTCVYAEGDAILFAKNKGGPYYQSFPSQGSTHTFLTTRGPTGEDHPEQHLWRVTGNIVHASAYSGDAKARRTCFLLVHGGFKYAAIPPPPPLPTPPGSQ